MFEVSLFNPILLRSEIVHTFPICSESEAVAKAEKFLFAQGVKLGDLKLKGAEQGQTVFGFNDQNSIATEAGGYHCVTNSVYFIFKYIKENLGVKVNTFIDLGCGPGNILISAHNLLGAARSTGIEIDVELVAQAKRNTERFGAEIIQADMLVEIPVANSYDLVYTYEPFWDETPRSKFLANLKAWLNDGQYVFYQHTDGELPQWLTEIKIPNFNHPCLFTFDKSKA